MASRPLVQIHEPGLRHSPAPSRTKQTLVVFGRKMPSTRVVHYSQRVFRSGQKASNIRLGGDFNEEAFREQRG